MNYKTIIENPEILKRDITFLEYIEEEIRHYQLYHDDSIYRVKNPSELDVDFNYELEAKILKREIMTLKMIRDKFYEITDNTNKEINK